MPESSFAFCFELGGINGCISQISLMYVYLTLGTILMFGPVVWGAVSSFKTPAELEKYPPSFLPYANETIEVEGYDRPLSMYTVTLDDGSVQS
jgi:alpha-1,4-digalacturonate transport system permease protein